MALPQKVYQLATLYSISGAATGVYVMTSVAGKFNVPVDLLALILALLVAVSLYLLRPEKVPWWNPVHALLIGINGSLIFIHALGFNSATQAFPTSPASKVTKASLFPSFDAVPWFPPADQRIAAQDVARAVEASLASSKLVHTSLGDLSAPIRDQRARLEGRLSEERPRVERELRDERLSMEGRLRDERARLEERLRGLAGERQRLEEALAKGVHPAERGSVEKALFEVSQSEQRLRVEIEASERRAQQMLAELAAQESQKLAGLAATEERLRTEIRGVIAKERRVKELEKEAAPLLQTVKQEIDTSGMRLNEAAQKLDRSYAGARLYFSQLPSEH